MIDTYLHGALADEYGEHYRFVAERPTDVIRALSSQLDGFAERLRDGNYIVSSSEAELSEDELSLGFGKRTDFHIIPEAEGAKGGLGKALTGAALIGAAFVPGVALFEAPLFTLGTSMALSGITTMTTKMPKSNYENTNDSNKTSALFDGPINNSGQGIPIPLVYGRVLAGSTVVTAGMSVEQLKLNND